MKKLKAIIASLCLVGALGLATPTITKADDSTGPQGASKSTTPAPPPPSSYDLWAILLWLIMLLFGQ
ncbi:MAG TPA: hypothetical protein VE863_17485 [Pyrinomonadaceae bacterium]|jgi:hypothetical protein|nr:hypothetical protein [Pyrinomonadaceae bacterium]